MTDGITFNQNAASRAITIRFGITDYDITPVVR